MPAEEKVAGVNSRGGVAGLLDTGSMLIQEDVTADSNPPRKIARIPMIARISEVKEQEFSA